MINMKLLSEFRQLATNLHGAQLYGKYPYNYHLSMVEQVARQYSFLIPTMFSIKSMYIACWFHDVLEDCAGVTAEQLLTHGLPSEAVELVVAVTDCGGANRSEQKLCMFDKCAGKVPQTFLKLCDRIVNVRTCLAEQNQFLGMYRKEHTEFHRRLYTGEMVIMWHELDVMLNQWEDEW